MRRSGSPALSTPTEWGRASRGSAPSMADVESAVASSGAGGVVISATSMPSAALTGLVRRLQQKTVPPLQRHHGRAPAPAAGAAGRLSAPHLRGAQCLSPLQLTAKRALDVVGAAIGLIVSTPLLLLAAVAIKRSDGGPVLFRQQRIGRDGQAFTILKLRTMCVDAGVQRLAEVHTLDEHQGPISRPATIHTRHRRGAVPAGEQHR